MPASALVPWRCAACRPIAASPRRLGPPPDQKPSYRRRLGFPAGPLESRRRRFGKRQMAVAVATPSAFPILWQWGAPPSWTTPRWEPPSTPSQRREKEHRLGTYKFFGWPSGPGAVSWPTTGASMDEAPPPALRQQDIQKLRESISQLHGVDKKTLWKLVRSFRKWLTRQTRCGELSALPVDHLVQPLDPATCARIPTELADAVISSFHFSLTDAMKVYGRRNAENVPPALWLSMVRQACDLEFSGWTVHLLMQLLCRMPPALRIEVPPSQVAKLGRALVLAQASGDQLISGKPLDTLTYFAKAMRQLSAAQRRHAFDYMRTFVQLKNGSDEERLRLRFSLLVIKARDADTETRDFARAYRLLMEPATRLDPVQLWQLTMSRLVAGRFLLAKVERQLLREDCFSADRRWARLVMALNTMHHRDDCFRALCSFLGSIGEFERMVQALARTPLRWVPLPAVLAMAGATVDHKQALLIYDSIRIKHEDSSELIEWGRALWARRAEAMTKDRAVEPQWIWKLLVSEAFPDRARPPKDAVVTVEDEELFGMWEQMARWFAEASHLSERLRLRELERGMRWQKYLTGRVSRQVLGLLADAITADLDRGQRGRTERLRWLVHLVHRENGAESALKTAEVLRRWRHAVEGNGGPPPSSMDAQSDKPAAASGLPHHSAISLQIE